MAGMEEVEITGRRSLIIGATLVAAVLFGAVDQWIGSRNNPALTQISVGMSALWLVVPFLVGVAVARQFDAIVTGLVATWLAVLAYAAMIVSPWEGTHLGPPPPGFRGSWNQLSPEVLWHALSSQSVWFAGGLLSGPLMGLLGAEWRARRHWGYALPVALALVFEPVARWIAGRLGIGDINGTPLNWPVDRAAQVAEGFEFLVGAVATWWLVRVGGPSTQRPEVRSTSDGR